MAKVVALPTAAAEPVRQHFGTRWRGRFPRDVVPAWRMNQKRISREHSRKEEDARKLAELERQLQVLIAQSIPITEQIVDVKKKLQARGELR